MKSLARLHFSPRDQGPVRVRTLPLLIGPSGVGKSHLVRELGRQLGVHVLKFTVGDWMIECGRHEPSSYRRIRQQLERDEKVLVHIDELDKFELTDDSWTRALFGEIFGLLDGSPGAVMKSPATGPAVGWTEQLVHRLKTRAFIVGSGTWQSLYSQVRRPIGFCSGNGTQTVMNHEALTARIRESEVIPPELLNRFGGWIFLDPLTRDDFTRISHSLNLPSKVLDPALAEASGLNFRYVENVMTEKALRDLSWDAENFPWPDPSVKDS